MQTKVQPEAPTTSPALTDQRVRLVIEAEIFQDLDGGPDSLIVTTDELACQPISPARLLGMVADARAQLDEIERLAKEYEARDTLAAILAEHDVQMEEWDTGSLDPKLRDRFVAFAMLHKDGSRLVVVPEGQNPIERLAAVAELIVDLRSAA